jgi:hydroxymethylpyrimidine/phosphomethylpyrimidine kinase
MRCAGVIAGASLFMRVALTIAGSDSGGGAGIQADLKTFHQHCVFGTTAITAITAQNTRGVDAWEPVSLRLIRAQIDAVAIDIRPDAIKTGMLGTADIAREVARAIKDHRLGQLVLDPVLIATSGDSLGEPSVVVVIREALAPLATLITPNADEAAVLVGKPIQSEEDLSAAAEWLVRELGAGAALVKGGHLGGPYVVDALYDGELTLFRRPRLATDRTHGTGCTLAAAIAARLARKEPLRAAVGSAGDWVHRAIAEAPGLGGGRGPVNHFAAGTEAEPVH